MTDLGRQTDYWNGVGVTKTFSHPLALDRLGAWLPGSGFVVDIGCGYGRTLHHVAAAGDYQVVGVDSALEMRRAARAHDVLVPLVVGDARDVPLKDQCADAVLLFAVLTCIPSDSDQRAVLAEVQRVLRPGGLVYVSDYWLQPDPRNRARYDRDAARFDRYGVFALEDGAVVRHHDRAWIDELMRAFTLVDAWDLDVITMNGHTAQAFQWVGRAQG